MTEKPEQKRTATPVLDIAYEVSGPAEGVPVILLHGWPDDGRTWDRVLPAFHAAGFRTYVPWLRGYGGTRFLDANAMRSGQLSALGQDLLDFADSLGLQRFAVIGHDWGARAAYIASCLAPARISHSVALSVGWGTNDPDQTLPLSQAQNYWYHWYMALPRGERLVREERRTYTRYIWDIWNPNWQFTDAEFDTTASSFDNPDWADVTLHSYRSRWGHAPADPACAELEKHLKADPRIAVPTLCIHGGGDPVNAPATSEGKEGLFTGPYRRVVLGTIGHFPQREDPEGMCAHALPFLNERF
jgi:pimeloyl-ACP methyl ester carboxylesterase